MNILITGGCGFIGSNLATFQIEKGDNVLVIDDLSTGSLKNIEHLRDNPRFRFEEANVVDWSGLKDAVDWADCIYHMAAVIGIFRVLAEPIRVMNTNVTGTERLFQTASLFGQKKRVFLASSSCVYGDALDSEEDGDLIVRQKNNPLLNYGVSKLADECIALGYFKETSLPVTIVRLFNVIGPRQTGQYGMVVPRFVKQACHNKPITIFGDGTQTRSFCDVRDAITALQLLGEKDNTVGEIFNVGNSKETSIYDLALLVRSLANSSSELEYIPYEEAYGGKFYDTPQRKPNLKKLVEFTQFKHRWTLEDTVNELIQIERGS